LALENERPVVKGPDFGEAPPPDTLAQIEVQDADVALLAPCPATAA
jgi:hypothetical protein